MKHTFLRLHQERRSKPFLLLEIGMFHLRLHAVDAGREPIRITLLGEESLAPGDASMLLDAVRHVLDIDSTVRDLAIVMNSPAIRHQMLSIPPLRAAERQKILRLEMKHSSTSEEPLGIVSFWSARKIKEREMTKEYVLCAELPRAVAEGLIAAVREKRFNLIGFTSHAQMVSHLLKECPSEGNLNVALLEVNEREGSVTLFHSNIWNMDRHFLIGGSGILPEFKLPTDPDANKLRLEVGRALQYFKQQVRSENIGHIFLYGGTNRALEIGKLLESSFRIPVTPVALEGKTFAAQDAAASREGRLPLYSIAHAAALHARFENYIDFLPPEWRWEKQLKIRQWALAGSAVALYALLGGFAYLFHQEAARITAREQASAQVPLVHASQPQSVQELQASRDFALATEQSDEWLRRRHHLVAELARELAGVAPPQMRITALELDEKGDAWQVKLEAEIHSPNGSRSRQLFLMFQEQMRRLSCLKQLIWGDVQLADSASGLRTQTSLTFTMRGLMSDPPFSVNP